MEYKFERIEYGKFKNDEWKTLNDLESAKRTLDRIKTEINWSGFSLWVHGSILSDVDTYDIDMTIMGPMQIYKIQELLEECTRIGFEEKQLVDVKYSISNELYDPVNDSPKTLIFARYKGLIVVNDIPYVFGKLVHNLFLKEQKFPMSKTLNAMEEGRVYKSPLQVI